MADSRYFAKLDLGYFENPKVSEFLDEHPYVPILHLRAILYCRQHLTNGKFPIRQVVRLASASYCGSQCGSQCDFCRAVDAGLFRRADDRFALVHDYLEHQDSAEQAAKRKAAAQKAAAARWSPEGDADSNADRIAPGNADRNAEERRGEEKKERGATSRGTRIPDGFEVTADLRAWAEEKGYGHLDLDDITEQFVDYWRGKAGKDATKANWEATWRNWVKRELQYAEGRAPKRRAPEPVPLRGMPPEPCGTCGAPHEVGHYDGCPEAAA